MIEKWNFNLYEKNEKIFNKKWKKKSEINEILEL
jgi:hypothetical protein